MKEELSNKLGDAYYKTDYIDKALKYYDLAI